MCMYLTRISLHVQSDPDIEIDLHYQIDKSFVQYFLQYPSQCESPKGRPCSRLYLALPDTL